MLFERPQHAHKIERRLGREKALLRQQEMLLWLDDGFREEGFRVWGLGVFGFRV